LAWSRYARLIPLVMRASATDRRVEARRHSGYNPSRQRTHTQVLSDALAAVMRADVQPHPPDGGVEAFMMRHGETKPPAGIGYATCRANIGPPPLIEISQEYGSCPTTRTVSTAGTMPRVRTFTSTCAKTQCPSRATTRRQPMPPQAAASSHGNRPLFQHPKISLDLTAVARRPSRPFS
jgi:hypothetical protein